MPKSSPDRPQVACGVPPFIGLKRRMEIDPKCLGGGAGDSAWVGVVTSELAGDRLQERQAVSRLEPQGGGVDLGEVGFGDC
jgi:hypothetical protein